ncbi:MAG TPA: acyl carrier protein [Kofleriaceae bacterium]
MADICTAGKSVDDIREWLVAAVTQRQRNRVPIVTSQPFYMYEVDSVERVSIAYELEVWLGREVSDSALVEYDSIDKLAAYLAEQ